MFTTLKVWMAFALLALPGLVAAQKPDARQAAESKISAYLVKNQRDGALAAYDAYVATVKAPDVALLASVARAELQTVARSQTDRGLLAEALERLARHGDSTARTSLKRLARVGASSTEADLAPAVSLARLGDPDAAEQLGEALATAPWEAKPKLINALKSAGARSQAPRVAALLTDPEPRVRTAAALAIGTLGYKQAIPQLQALFETDVATVKITAAVSLRRLGQSSVDEYLDALIRNGVPDVQLIAAQAYVGSKSTHWIDSLKRLRSDRNEMSRVRAAELLACCDAATARAILIEALGNENPLMRTEAARILEQTGTADARLARRMLGDEFEHVRIYGAGATMALAAASQARK
jgi:HEAT repeat protein